MQLCSYSLCRNVHGDVKRADPAGQLHDAVLLIEGSDAWAPICCICPDLDVHLPGLSQFKLGSTSRHAVDVQAADVANAAHKTAAFKAPSEVCGQMHLVIGTF